MAAIVGEIVARVSAGNLAKRQRQYGLRRQAEHMKFLTRLSTGQIALWCIFWLIGTPLVLLWDVSGICTVVGCGIQTPTIEGFLLVLFTLTSVAIPFVSVAIWRSASKYPRQVWWQTVLAIGAKLSAVFSALLAAIGLAVILYMTFIFIYASMDRF